jgi:hypothetical protein
LSPPLSSFALPAVILHFAFGFGAIHLLALWVLVQVAGGAGRARGPDRAASRAHGGLYWQGLTVAGLLTLLPGRILNDVLFAARPEIGIWVILGFGAGLLGDATRRADGARAPGTLMRAR